jgi:hypothetical protein
VLERLELVARTDGLTAGYGASFRSLQCEEATTPTRSRRARPTCLSSGMHRMVQANFADVTWEKRTWASSTAYAESKLYDVLLAFAIARRWRDVLSKALESGWVPHANGRARCAG